MNRNKLSKLMSYILRHHPEEYGITLDEQGFVDLTTFIKAIQTKHPEVIWADVIREVHDFTDKKRFETVGDKIRALHGHSTKVGKLHDTVEPPRTLYHGTSRDAYYKHIINEGLKPMNRKHVHLTDDLKMAITVGKRYDKNPVILKIETNLCDSTFMNLSENVWLTDNVPTKAITLL